MGLKDLTEEKELLAQQIEVWFYRENAPVCCVSFVQSIHYYYYYSYYCYNNNEIANLFDSLGIQKNPKARNSRPHYIRGEL